MPVKLIVRYKYDLNSIWVSTYGIGSGVLGYASFLSIPRYQCTTEQLLSDVLVLLNGAVDLFVIFITFVTYMYCYTVILFLQFPNTSNRFLTGARPKHPRPVLLSCSLQYNTWGQLFCSRNHTQFYSMTNIPWHHTIFT